MLVKAERAISFYFPSDHKSRCILCVSVWIEIFLDVGECEFVEVEFDHKQEINKNTLQRILCVIKTSMLAERMNLALNNIWLEWYEWNGFLIK